jgi:hypothetical protein
MNEKVMELSKTLLQREFNVGETNDLLNMDMGRVICWGITKRIKVNNGGLLLKVNGHHHKGYVLITLGWEDLYKFHLITDKGVLKESVEGVFFEDLSKQIDQKIEYIPQYGY